MSLFAESGYCVIASRSRSEALVEARQSRSIQLLLAETRPPDERDEELLQTFRTLHPDAGIILMSALSEHDLDPVVEIVTKPIRFEPLLALIDDVLVRRQRQRGQSV